MNLLNKLVGSLAVLLLLLVLSGCETTNHTNNPPIPTKLVGNYINKGDLLMVVFAGVEQSIPPHEERVKEDGTITLSLIGSVKAEGKTPGQLQQDIREAYITNGLYKGSLNVTVKLPDRFFFVGGEVKAASRYQWVEGMTLIKAIQTAGYFSEFAKRTKIRVTRQDGQKFVVNYDAALIDSSRDLPIYPGDSIDVPRKW
jgi:polysaccharide export outer membrane protein